MQEVEGIITFEFSEDFETTATAFSKAMSVFNKNLHYGGHFVAVVGKFGIDIETDDYYNRIEDIGEVIRAFQKAILEGSITMSVNMVGWDIIRYFITKDDFVLK